MNPREEKMTPGSVMMSSQLTGVFSLGGLRV